MAIIMNSAGGASGYPTTATTRDYTLAPSATITSLNIDVSDGKAHVLTVYEGTAGQGAPIFGVILDETVVVSMASYSVGVSNGKVTGTSVSSATTTTIRDYILE